MKLLKKLLLFIVGTLLVVVFLEVFIKLVLPLSPYTDERNLTYNFDSELGWFPKKNSKKWYQGSKRIQVSHNSLGFRDIEFQSNDKPNIIFLGDSFTWGYDVEVKERFTDKLRLRLQDKYNILNLGVSGYGTDQQFILLKKYFELFKPVLVFVILNNTDFDDNSRNLVYNGYYKPYFITENNELILKGSPVSLATNYSSLNLKEDYPFLSKFELLKVYLKVKKNISHFFHSRVNSNPTVSILVEMDKYLISRASKLRIGLVDEIPEMTKVLTQKNISWINLENNFRYPSHGFHWTPAGHDFVMEKILKEIE